MATDVTEAELPPELKKLIKISEPLNDIQLVALIASRDMDQSPEKAVALAIELVAEAVVQCADGRLQDLVIKKYQAIQDHKKA